jgi:hypothetical protein
MLSEVGTCVLGADGSLFRGDLAELEDALRRGGMRYHRGRIRGALPEIVGVGH